MALFIRGESSTNMNSRERISDGLGITLLSFLGLLAKTGLAGHGGSFLSLRGGDLLQSLDS